MSTQLDWINQLGAAQANSEARIAALADAQIRTEEKLSRLETVVAQLATQQSETDARLNKLAETVERYISGGRNGQS